MKRIVIDGAEHEIRPPASAVERVEMHDAYLTYIQQPGGTARAAAIMLYAMVPSLRPARLAWTGTNAAEVGRLMLDHLVAMGLGIHDLEEVVLSAGMYDALRAACPPARASVKAAVKNS